MAASVLLPPGEASAPLVARRPSLVFRVGRRRAPAAARALCSVGFCSSRLGVCVGEGSVLLLFPPAPPSPSSACRCPSPCSFRICSCSSSSVSAPPPPPPPPPPPSSPSSLLRLGPSVRPGAARGCRRRRRRARRPQAPPGLRAPPLLRRLLRTLPLASFPAVGPSPPSAAPSSWPSRLCLPSCSCCLCKHADSGSVASGGSLTGP